MQINYPNNFALRKVSSINPVSIGIPELDYLTVQIIPFSKKHLYSHTREQAYRLRIPDDKSDSATPIILNKNKNRLSCRLLTRTGSSALKTLRYNS